MAWIITTEKKINVYFDRYTPIDGNVVDKDVVYKLKFHGIGYHTAGRYFYMIIQEFFPQKSIPLRSHRSSLWHINIKKVNKKLLVPQIEID